MRDVNVNQLSSHSDRQVLPHSGLFLKYMWEKALYLDNRSYPQIDRAWYYDDESLILYP